MRPQRRHHVPSWGVVERVRAAQQADRDWYAARPHLALAHHTRRFISLTGLLWFHDHPVQGTLEVLSEVITAHTTGAGLATDGEQPQRCLSVASMLAGRVGLSREPSSEQIDEAQELLLTIPPRVLLRREDADAHPDLTLVNEAWWRAEGTSTPYSAACMVGAVGYWRPEDRWGSARRMSELRTRFEDEPAERAAIEQEITDSLERFLVDYELWWAEADSEPSA
jgi:hypothetical protein